MELPTNRVAWLGTLPKGSVGAEIGVDEASFSKWAWRIVEPSLLWMVDCYQTQPSVPYNLPDEWYVRRCYLASARAAEQVVRGVVRQLCGFSAEAAQWVPDDSLDWVYIDAGHTFCEVLDDLGAWYPKVKRGGIVAGHDYVRGRDLGVIEAVRMFRKQVCDGLLHVTREKLPSFWWRKA